MLPSEAESYNIPLNVDLLGFCFAFVFVLMQWMWSDSNHVFCVFCADNSSVSLFSKSGGFCLFVGMDVLSVLFVYTLRVWGACGCPLLHLLAILLYSEA